jgi:hypothetical protein
MCIPFAIGFVKCTCIKDQKLGKNAGRCWHRNNVSFSQAAPAWQFSNLLKRLALALAYIFSVKRGRGHVVFILPILKGVAGLWRLYFNCKGHIKNSHRETYLITQKERHLSKALFVRWHAMKSQFLKKMCTVYRARIFKLSRSLKIDSKEPISPGCVAWRVSTTTLFLLCSLPP